MKKLLLLTICATALSLQVQAADRAAGQVLTSPRPVETSSEWKPHFGLIAGVADTEGSSDAVGEYGFDIGYQYYIPYSLGLEYTHARITGAAGSDQDRDSVWIKGTYNFAGDNMFISHSYASLAVGAVFTNQTSAAVAPILGFDIPIKDDTRKSSYFSLGANTRYAFIGNNEDDTFSVSGVVKYWY